MKMMLIDPLTVLDKKVTSFTVFPIAEDDYFDYASIAESGFLHTEKWILHLEKKNKAYFIQPVCTYVKIKYRQQDIITNENSYCIEIYNGKDHIDETFGSGVLTSQGCKELLKYGCIYDENQVRVLLKYLTMSALRAPPKNVHTRLGWIWDYEQPVFLSNKAISQISFKSEYSGNLDLVPKGSLTNWLKWVQCEVIGNTALTTGLLVGFASSILSYINHFIDLGCMVFSYSNVSSKGKTTLAMLAASIFGNPASESGFFTTMDSTQKALVAFVSLANSCTVSLDETGTADKKDIRQTLYRIASGHERGRSNPDGTLQEKHTFNSCIICTSEFPIIDESAPNGIRVRVFELHDDLTTSAENADNIKSCVYHNYGHAGRKFVRYIVCNKLDCILDDYYAAKDELMNLFNVKCYIAGELTDRILSKLAVILQTAYYVKECFSLKLPTSDIAEYLLQIERSVTTEADIATRALDCILEYVTRNNHRFLHDNDKYFNSDLDGTVKVIGKRREICVLKSVVDKNLSENGFDSPRDIYDIWWKKMKILDSEKDRATKRKVLVKGLPDQPCFIFNLKK